MINLARLTLGGMAFLVTLFCIFGFLASFDARLTRWKIGYALAFFAFGMLSLQLVCKGIEVWRRAPRRRDHMALTSVRRQGSTDPQFRKDLEWRIPSNGRTRPS